MAKKPPPDTFHIPVPQIPIPGLPNVSIGGNFTIVVQPNGGVSIPSFGIKIRFGSEPPTDLPQPPPPNPQLNPPDPIPFPFGSRDTHDDHDDGAEHDDHDDQPHDDHDDGAEHDDHNDQPHDDHNDQPHDDHDDQPHDDHDDQPHDDHDDQPHDDHDDQPHDDHDDEPFDDDGFEAADEFMSDDLGPAAPNPGSFPMTVQNVQLPNAPPGTYFVGTFTANVAADGTTTISNWNVTLNFAWPGGGTSAIPPPA